MNPEILQCDGSRKRMCQDALSLTGDSPLVYISTERKQNSIFMELQRVDVSDVSTGIQLQH